MKLSATLLSTAQKLLYSLAVIASLLLVIDVAAPWLVSEILTPFRDFFHGLSEIEANILFYLLLQAVTIPGLLLFMRFFNAKIAELGVGKARHWYLVLLTPLMLVGYMIVTIAISTLVGVVFPDFNGGEKQEIGLSPDGAPNLLLTALFLCVLVPLAEEFAFRGYLFGLLRKKLSFLTVAVIVSVAFAVLHLLFDTASSGGLVVKQLNVAVDVFILSLFLCYLRERTNSIWAGVALHGLKNFIAFLLLFVYNVG